MTDMDPIIPWLEPSRPLSKAERDDLADLTLAITRELTTEGDPVSLDDLLTMLGYRREDLRRWAE